LLFMVAICTSFFVCYQKTSNNFNILSLDYKG